jgi:PKD repeat protein
VQQACQFPFPSVIRYQGIGATTFLWKVDGVTVSNTNVFNFQFPNAGNYVVTLTAGNPVACLPSITVTKIFKVSMVSIDQNTNITACKGVPVQLTSNITSSNPFTYSWTPTTGLDNPTIANPTATPTQTTTYTLTATDNNGCVRTKTAKVTIIPPLTNDFDIFNGANIPAGEFCLPAFVRLKYDTTGLGLQVSSWTWDVQNVGIFTNQAQVNLTINQVGSYTITLTVNRIGQCPETLTKTKTIIVKSLGLQVSPTQTICIGGNTQLNATSTFANVQYSWSPVLGLSNPNIPNPIANPTRTTSYLITISDNTGCQSEANVLVEVEPDIKGDFEWEYISDCGKPTAIQLKPSFQGGNQFLWTISDGTTYNTEIPNAHIFKNAGIYTITALVKNGACQKTFQKTIEVENNALAPPNVITPNNDGKNETFVIPDRQNYKLEIYTRIGTSVFKSDNYQNDWGQDALVGVYYYLLTSPKGVKCKGWIEVMK